MKFHLWLSWKFFKTKKNILSLTSYLSFISLVIGVASLVVSMAVVSGYQETLKKSITSVVGHMVLVKSRLKYQDIDKFLAENKSVAQEITHLTPFVFLEGVIAKNGKLNGVFIEGVDAEKSKDVLGYKNKIVLGSFDLKKNTVPKVILGKGIFKKYKLNLNDTIKIVLPVHDELNTQNFKPRVRSFKISGVIDLGRHDYNEKYVMIDLAEAQSFAEIKDKITGLRIKIKNEDDVDRVKDLINNKNDFGLWAKSWKDYDKTLFKAAKLEKIIIFVVLLIMLIAAGFNISSSLFINVFKRISDISILKSLGLKNRSLMIVFNLQGLFIGALGSLLGIVFGFIICFMFEFAQKTFDLLPSHVYKLEFIDFKLNIGEILLIMGVSVLICIVSTFAAARRASKLGAIEGLRYE